MTTFPKLKTNAVAQYPATKTQRYQNQIVRFVDGTEQRYRDSAGPLHRWAISLDQLDEAEMTAMEQFLQANQGQFASFAFTDPWDGTQYGTCSLSSDGMDLSSLGEMLGKTSLTVVEIRG
ncbi:MAG TPA: DUF2460 domain-containing protein [Bryobacteraceae bacterium]|nr:DUF2460 domain-containing protein [Bryobacteraceae bacterium]